MGSVPRHPFFLKVIDSLKSYHINWIVPYITIMYSTGPLFLSAVWQSYKRWGVPAAAIVRIVLPPDYKGTEHSFFQVTKGNSWHQDDAKVLLTIAKHIPITVVCGFLLAFTLMYLEYLVVCYFTSSHFSRFRKGCWNLITLKPWSYGNNYTRLNPHKQAKYLKTRNRKDSNLPVALNIDLEKNVSEIVDEEVY
ncbi:unnamed protein product [Ambrosiozyma monospora]|uniref:Unnamed protein product n=1 Tax=Ambrosiozyma monospora TaxID=43982 RepID=A0ACB5TD28_AMBMO|nr:unnamed protein product [Ambrosiozyma monospora]